jgi:protoporphyrinogen oxidase
MSRHVAVLGGGISGLAAAHQLSKRGHRVTLLEADAHLGGLGSTFEHAGIPIERFYHCLLPTDAALLRLVGEIGLGGEVIWRNVGMGFMVDRRTYPMNGALDLLRFSPLPIFDRLRLGWMGLRARARGADPALDSVSARDWIVGLAGERNFERLWRPLLEAKLGEGAGGIPALWLASRIAREKGKSVEVKGFVPGGYRALVAAIERALRARGSEIRVKCPVQKVGIAGDHVVVDSASGRETFDSAVAALPLVEFQRIARDVAEMGALADLRLDYQGVVNGVFLLRRPLTPYYWLPIMESGATSQGIVETSNLVPPERTGGLHVVYLLNYVHRTSELFRRPDAEVLALYRRDLLALYPGVEKDIEAQYLFRAPFVEPIWPLGFRAKRPGPVVVPGKLYLASTAQVYPRINAWDSCCGVAEEMAAAFAAEARAAAKLEPVAKA